MGIPKKLTRRKFLKSVGITGGMLALPTLLGGYSLLQATDGDLPPCESPYSMLEVDALSSVTGIGSPILVLTNERSDNPFGFYLTEILRTEGLNCFQVASISALERNTLEHFDFVLLAEGLLNTRERELLTDYVSRDGRLVAMRPDAQLASLFGVERISGSTTEGYLQVDVKHPIGQGIAPETLQFHGIAAHYHLAGAQPVAWLASDINTLTNFPAVAIYRHGEGQTAFWAFDLARSVAYTRQGNPDWANEERDWDGIRAVNMFFSPNKDWANLDRLPIPQADEQQRLLVNLLTTLSQEKRPLPRLWYFPAEAKGVLVPTGDYHINPAAPIEETLSIVEQYNGRMSIYFSPWLVGDGERAARRVRYWASDHLPLARDLLAERYKSPTPRLIADWRARGHEFTIHPYVEEGIEQGLKRYWEEFTGRGYGPVSPTVRTHRILWTGWTETARIQASHGIRLNLDYYHWGPALQNEAGEWVFGYLTGSGLPMKFVDEQGRILNIYQQLTELADDHMVNFGWEWDGPAKLSVEESVEVARTLFRRSVEGAYTAFVGQFHIDPFANGGQLADRAKHFLEGTLDAATSYDMPIWSAQEWLRFTEVRHDTNFTAVQWHPGTQRLSFQLVAQEIPDVILTVMLPLQHNQANLKQIEVDGQILKHTKQKLGGVSYGQVSLPAGSHQVMVSYL